MALCVALLALTPTATAFADPPPWAPAHGWRDKHEKKHKHDKHDRYHRDDDDDDDRIIIFRDRDHYHDRYRPAPQWQSFYGLPLGLDGGRCDTGLVNANLGTLLGALAGGLGGSQFGKGDGKIAATIGGVLLGAALGNAIERSMGPVDEACLAQTLERVPSGRPVVWNNPDSGTRYEVTPTRTFETDRGACREYTSRVTIGGRLETLTGTACRQPDGAWRIVG